MMCKPRLVSLLLRKSCPGPVTAVTKLRSSSGADPSPHSPPPCSSPRRPGPEVAAAGHRCGTHPPRAPAAANRQLSVPLLCRSAPPAAPQPLLKNSPDSRVHSVLSLTPFPTSLDFHSVLKCFTLCSISAPSTGVLQEPLKCGERQRAGTRKALSFRICSQFQMLSTGIRIY